MIREHEGYLYGPDSDQISPWIVRSWRCDCHPQARWGYYARYDGCGISDLNYAGSPTYSERHPDWPSLAAAHPTVRPVSGSGELMLFTVAERQYLAMHARYEAERQLDPRNYADDVHPDGSVVLNDQWPIRQVRHDRWRKIADWLHPDPWGGSEPLATFDEAGGS